jgi:hypothetical protein
MNDDGPLCANSGHLGLAEIAMSALHPEADIARPRGHVSFVPTTEVAAPQSITSRRELTRQSCNTPIWKVELDGAQT